MKTMYNIYIYTSNTCEQRAVTFISQGEPSCKWVKTAGEGVVGQYPKKEFTFGPTCSSDRLRDSHSSSLACSFFRDLISANFISVLSHLQIMAAPPTSKHQNIRIRIHPSCHKTTVVKQNQSAPNGLSDFPASFACGPICSLLSVSCWACA